MNIHEYQAKEILRGLGVPIPAGRGGRRPPTRRRRSRKKIGKPVVVKAQVHAGGRGKAGGVKLAKTPAEAQGESRGDPRHADQGPDGDEGLVTEAADIASEAYVGIILDRASKRPVFMVSAAGGIDIEEVAATTPEKILKMPVDTRFGLMPYQAMRLGFFLYAELAQARAAARIMQQLYIGVHSDRLHARRDQSAGGDA